MVYDRCTRVDADGWRIATLANVSFLENGRQRVECIPGTEKKAFRTIGNKDALRNYSKHENDVVMTISWVEGAAEAFPTDSFLRNRDYSGSGYMVTSLELDHDRDLECFPQISLETNELFPDSLYLPSFLCQKVNGTLVQYFFGLPATLATTLTTISEEKINLLTKKNGTVAVTMRYIETLQFEKDMVINAGQIANSEPRASEWDSYGEYCDSCSGHRGVSVRQHLHSLLGRLLYTRADNVTLEVPSAQFDVTVIPNKLLIIGTVEVGGVLLFGLFMYVLLEWCDLQMPNTLNGLSEVWAVSNDSSEHSGRRKRRFVTLRRRKPVGDEQHTILEPSALETPDGVEEKDIQAEFGPRNMRLEDERASSDV
ncbi:hypothetical protein FGB62_285g01 [Gracilaria domingensis]|nr:hypothetical protein FGB62_285g01 [Gracilaria domingensis]